MRYSAEHKPETRNRRLLIGKPLTMRRMAKHVRDAATYAPVTILADERPDGIHLFYDHMTSLVAPYENSHAVEAAKALDRKVESVLITAPQ